MTFSYYPGCTLSTKAKALDRCGRLSALVPSAQGGTALAQAIGDPLPIPLHLGFDFD